MEAEGLGGLQGDAGELYIPEEQVQLLQIAVFLKLTYKFSIILIF